MTFSGVKTNISTDGNTLFLPADDQEWVSMLGMVLDKYEQSLEDRMPTPSPRGYAVEILRFLLNNKIVNKSDIETFLSSKDVGIDDFLFGKGWWLVVDVLAMTDRSPDSNTGNLAFKLGKVGIRALLADDDYIYGRPQWVGQYIEANDYWPRGYERIP